MTDFISAYTDALSYGSGDTVRVYASGHAGVARVRLVRLTRGLDGSAAESAPVAWDGEADIALGEHPSCLGSFMVGDLDDVDASSGLTVGAHIWMPRPESDADQVIAEIADDDAAVRVAVRGGRVVAEWTSAADGTVFVAGPEVPAFHWVSVVASFGPQGAALHVGRPDDATGFSTNRVDAGQRRVPRAGQVTFAAKSPVDVAPSGPLWRGRAEAHFNGKIEAPFVAQGELSGDQVQAVVDARDAADVPGLRLLGCWDLAPSAAGSSSTIGSLVGAGRARLVNLPSSAVTGRSWDGRTTTFVVEPRQWNAVHFHQDDLVDSGWPVALEAALPRDLDSGLYGICVSGGSAADIVPIVIRPTTAHRAVTVLLPSFTYLAYANERLYDGLDHAALSDKPLVISEIDRFRMDDPDLGISQYDHHWDSSGVMFSSARRPILNMRHDQRMWLSGSPRHLAAEMLLIEWLDQEGVEFDVITDMDLHEGGVDALGDSRVLITGSHPEYHTLETMRATTEFRDAGGRIMYLGANGFYWVTGVVSTSPLVTEIRRGQTGIRSWESYPGEVTLQSTGEPGGLWRHRGMAPNTIVGVGMAAQGWGQSEPYWRAPASFSDSYSWIFDGVDEEPLGAYGFVMGGAAGDELDRFDPALGSPPGTVVLASSRNHTKYYQRVVEEVAMNFPGYGGGDQDPEVHADIVYVETPGGGRVFSVGSIAWSGALLVNGGDNGVSRVTRNVLRGFLST